VRDGRISRAISEDDAFLSSFVLDGRFHCISAVLLLMPGEITRLRLIENRLGSLKDNGAFLLPRWPGTIGESDSLQLDTGQSSPSRRPVRKRHA